MSLQGDKTKALFDRAKQVIPHGVNSNFRYWGDDDTLVISRGEDHSGTFLPWSSETRPGSDRRRYGIRLDNAIGD